MIYFVKQRYTNTCLNSFSTSTLRQMALARMLVIVSTIFILTASPIVALSIARSTVYDLFIDCSYNIVFVLCCYLTPSTCSSECSTPAVSLFRLRSEVVMVSPGKPTFMCFRFLKDRRAGLKKESGNVNTMTTGE